MAPKEQGIFYKTRGKIGFITINTKMNTINIENAKKFHEILDEIEADEKVQVIIIKSEGNKVFSAGWDLNIFGKDFINKKEEFFKYCGTISKRLYFLKKPIITQIQGSAIGTGVTLSFSSDFRFVANREDLYFKLPEIDLPLFPTTGPTVSTFSVIGPVNTKHMLLTGNKIYLKTLEKWGAFTKICEPESLEKDVLRFAKRLSRKPGELLQMIKSTVNIMGMNKANAWYDLENDMSDYFYAESLYGKEKEDINTFLKKIW